jgi:hypothetical protein
MVVAPPSYRERDEADVPVALPGSRFQPIDGEPFVQDLSNPPELLPILIIRTEEEFCCSANLLHKMTHAARFSRDFGKVEGLAVQMQHIAKF